MSATHGTCKLSPCVDRLAAEKAIREAAKVAAAAREAQRRAALRAAQTPAQTGAARSRDSSARRGARKGRSLKARGAEDVLSGKQIVKPFTFGKLGGAGEGHTCQWCKAELFESEAINLCCSGGLVKVDPFPEPSPHLKGLLENLDQPDSKTFMKHIQKFNQALSFASLTINYQNPFWARNGAFNPNVVITGRSYYNIGAVRPEPGVVPRNSQVYLYYALKCGTNNRGCRCMCTIP